MMKKKRKCKKVHKERKRHYIYNFRYMREDKNLLLLFHAYVLF